MEQTATKLSKAPPVTQACFAKTVFTIGSTAFAARLFPPFPTVSREVAIQVLEESREMRLARV